MTKDTLPTPESLTIWDRSFVEVGRAGAIRMKGCKSNRCSGPLRPFFEKFFEYEVGYNARAGKLGPVYGPATDLAMSVYRANAPDLARSETGVGPDRWYWRVIFDVDVPKGTRPEDVIAEADRSTVKLVAYLKHAGVTAEDMKVFFTGSKGLSLELNSASFWPRDGNGDPQFLDCKTSQVIVRAFTRLVCERAGVPYGQSDGDLPAVDAAMANSRQFSRLPGAINSKSVGKFGRLLRRIELSLGDVGSLKQSQVLDEAEKARSLRPVEFRLSAPRNDVLVGLFAEAEASVHSPEPVERKHKSAPGEKSNRRVQLPVLQPYPEPTVKALAKEMPACLRSIREGAITRTGIRNEVGVPVCVAHLARGDDFNAVLETMSKVPTSSDIYTETRGQWNSIANSGRYVMGPHTCAKLRSCGAACSSSCPAHEVFAEHSTRLQATQRPHTWADVSETTVAEAREALEHEIRFGHDDVCAAYQPGVGKSYTAGLAAVRKCSEEPGVRVLIVAPTRRQIKQYADRLGAQSVHVIQPRLSDNCVRPELAEAAGAQGHRVVKKVCGNCPKFAAALPTTSACGWWQQYDTDKQVIICTAHAAATGMPQRYFKPDLVILDEQPVASCVRAIGPEVGCDARLLRQVASALPEPWTSFDEDGFPKTYVEFGFGDLEGSCAKLLRSVAGQLQLCGAVNEEHLLGLRAQEELLDFPGSHNLLREAKAEVVRAKGAKVEMEPAFCLGAPPAICRSVIRLLAGAGAVPLLIEKAGAEPLLRIRRFTPLEFDPTTRIVALDATAVPELLAKVVGRDLGRVERPIVPLEGQVRQIASPGLGIGTLTKPGSQKKWISATVRLAKELLAAGKNSVLVICHMRIEVAVIQALVSEGLFEPDDKGRVVVRHFGGVRGESLEGFEASIVLGFPQAPRHAVLLDAMAVHEGDDIDEGFEPRWMPHMASCDDGFAWGRDVVMPVDPRVRALWEISSVHELIQAAHRNRAVIHDHICYLLTGVPLSDPGTPVGLIEESDVVGVAPETKVERVVRWADRLQGRLGWVSKNLLLALASADSGYPDLLAHPLKENQLRGCANKYPVVLTILTRGPAEVTKVSKRWVDEAWDRFLAQGSFDVHTASLGVAGKKGRPVADEVVGSDLVWALDHEPWIRGSNLVIKLDGAPVKPEDLDHFMLHTHDWNDGRRRIGLDRWGMNEEDLEDRPPSRFAPPVKKLPAAEPHTPSYPPPEIEGLLDDIT